MSEEGEGNMNTQTGERESSSVSISTDNQPVQQNDLVVPNPNDFMAMMLQLQKDIVQLKNYQSKTNNDTAALPSPSFSSLRLKRKSTSSKAPQLGAAKVAKDSAATAVSPPLRVNQESLGGASDDDEVMYNDYCDDEVNVRASQSESYDTDYDEHENELPADDLRSQNKTFRDDLRSQIVNKSISKNSELENKLFSDIRIVSSSKVNKGAKINDDWAKTLNESWKSRKDKDDVKKLRADYPVPENCEFYAPKLNIELWQLLSSLQRKSDVKMATVQRNIISAASASLSIANDVLENKIDIKNVLQKTSDIIGLLGHASSDLSFKRKLFIRSVLKDEYKDLVSVNTEETEKLFGDNLSQNIKDLNLRNKLKQRSSYTRKDSNSRKPYSSGYSQNNNYNNKQTPFLGKGGRRMSSSNYHKSRRGKR